MEGGGSALEGDILALFMGMEFMMWLSLVGFNQTNLFIFLGVAKSSLTQFSFFQARMGQLMAKEMCGGTCGGKELFNLQDQISLNS